MCTINIKIEKLFLDASKYANIQLFKSQSNDKYKSRSHQTSQHQNYKKDQYRRRDDKKTKRNRY